MYAEDGLVVKTIDGFCKVNVAARVWLSVSRAFALSVRYACLPCGRNTDETHCVFLLSCPQRLSLSLSISFLSLSLSPPPLSLSLSLSLMG